MLDQAKEYHNAGLKVIPVFKGADAAPRFPANWAQYKAGQTLAQIEHLFASVPAGCDLWGVAIVMDDDMECIDIDVKHDPTGNIFNAYLEQVLWATGSNDVIYKATCVKTKSGGYHLIYRSDKTDGNRKLTHNEAGACTIETRGRGGLVFAAPTPGYEIQHGKYTDIWRITPEERDQLINSALNLTYRKPVALPETVKIEFTSSLHTDLTPWDDFNARHNCDEILQSYGWTKTRSKGNFDYYSKPNASNARDTHGAVIRDKNIFHPFTTATAFEPEKNYNPYSLFTVLEFAGDYKASARACLEKGYGAVRGSRIAAAVPIYIGSPEEVKTPERREAEDDFLTYLRSTSFDIHNPPKEEDAVLSLRHENKEYKIAPSGGIVAIVGEEKSGKSLALGCIISAALSGKPVLNFSHNTKGGRIIYFDTEQPTFFYGLTQKRIYRQARLTTNPPNYETYNLRRLDPSLRIKAIELILAQPGNIDIVVIDGIVDLCADFNDQKESAELMNKVLQWSDTTGATFYTVLHLTKGNGFMRGHLGTALQNKADAALQAARNKESNSFSLSCRLSRFAPFPLFEFERDEQTGDPYIPSLLLDQQEKIPVNTPELVRRRKGEDDDYVPF